MVRPDDGLRASSIVWGQMRRPDPHDPDDGHISSKSSKPLFGAFGQTEKTGFKVFGSFQPGLPRKVPQSP